MTMPGPRKLNSRDPRSLASKKFWFAEGDCVLERVLFVVNQEEVKGYEEVITAHKNVGIGRRSLLSVRQLVLRLSGERCHCSGSYGERRSSDS